MGIGKTVIKSNQSQNPPVIESDFACSRLGELPNSMQQNIGIEGMVHPVHVEFIPQRTCLSRTVSPWHIIWRPVNRRHRGQPPRFVPSLLKLPTSLPFEPTQTDCAGSARGSCQTASSPEFVNEHVHEIPDISVCSGNYLGYFFSDT